MKILVTGVAGFIGSHLAEKLLDMGHEVLGIDNLSAFYSTHLKQLNLQMLQSKGLKFLEIDLAAYTAEILVQQEVDYIFHLAAQPGLDDSCSLNDYVRNNIIATENLITFARQLSALKLFVNISTSSVYGLEATKAEDATVNPISWYGITKNAAEQLVLSNSRRGLFNACSLRLYSVYGPRERPDKLFSKLIHCGLNGVAFPLFEGSLEHIRSFSYVSDIVRGILAVLGRAEQLSNEIINIGNTESFSTKQGIAAVESILNRQIQLEMHPARKGDQHQTVAVIDKANTLLGFKPEISLLTGLEYQIAWARQTLLS